MTPHIHSEHASHTSVARALTWRYAIALALVATLSTAAWISLDLVITEQKSTAAVVNVSGRQRMLSQRTALFSNLLIDARKNERPAIRSKLREAIDLMDVSHQGLTHGNAEMGLPGVLSPTVHAMYFEGPDALDVQVDTYIKAVRELLQHEDDALRHDLPVMQYITRTAPGPLVAALDSMVQQYQLEGETAVAQLKHAETLFWLITLVLLLLEAALIFHPFTRHVRLIIGRLQQVSDELRLHHEHLEELVWQRTQELEHRSKELIESEEKFRVIGTFAKDAIVIVGSDEQIVYWNPAAEKIFGHTTDEVLGKNLHKLLTPDSYRDKAHQAFSRFRHSGEGDIIGTTFEISALRKNGEEFPVELSISAFRLHDQWHALGLIRDITERKQTETALHQQQQFSEDIINSLPGLFYMLDAGGRFIRVNALFLEQTGYSQQELDNMRALDLFEGDDKALIAARMQDVFMNGSASAEAELVLKSGQKVPYYFTGHISRRDGHSYLVGIGTDITERKRSEDALRIIASVFDNSQEAILITDADNNILEVNPAFIDITGYTREEVLGRNPRLLSSGRHDRDFYRGMWQTLQRDRAWRGEIWNRRKSGEIYAELLSISAIRDDEDKLQRYVGVFSDISHLKAHEAELSRIAHYDALTGIPNRVLLADRMKQAIAQTAREQNMLAVCYLDLDGFKQINDTLGHDAGDQVLVEIASRIGKTLRGGDTVARLGGDEFVVVLLGLEKGEECMATLERLLTVISEPMAVKEQSLALSTSIGVSLYPLDDEDPDTLLRHADQAMYVAKQSGKNRFHIYDPALDMRTRTQHAMLNNIREALEQQQFELHYQPKIDLRTRQLVGAEALIRWRHPQRGLLFPNEFLRPIENTSLDIEIGDWVIGNALQQLENWQQDGLDIEVSINISAHHLESRGFADKLQHQLSCHPKLPPGRLQIEVLETAALNDIAIVRDVIEACRKFGVRFALDDFGTGYSSLSYLSGLPVDVLKIDQSFVRDMLEDKGDFAIVQGIIALAHAFERQIVAEGIETEAHYRALLEMGCSYGQGYLIARPMPANELHHWKFK
ncbi:MAG: EAL domain-containing protein [Sideroxydans sp.]|nr:EAL domain-containing protein [Sideroxydans sp.]